MTAKIEVPNLDNLIQRYLAGEPIKELARETGVSPKILWKRFKSAGVEIRPKRYVLPDNLIARYNSGESEHSIAKSLGVARTVIRRRLLEAGIHPRTISDTMFMRWQSATLEQRAAMLNPAHSAVEGSKRTVEDLERRAIGKEKSLAHETIIERRLANWLRRQGCIVTQQKAVGIYNVDVAIEEPRIAVEIFGGNFHATGRHAGRFYKRFKYILNAGWSVVIVWVDGRRYPFSIGCIDYLESLINELRLHPASIGQYRVILGNGEPAPVFESYFNTPTHIERLYSPD